MQHISFCISLRILSITWWRVAGEFLRPIGIRYQSYKPFPVLKVVLGIFSSDISIHGIQTLNLCGIILTTAKFIQKVGDLLQAGAVSYCFLIQLTIIHNYMPFLLLRGIDFLRNNPNRRTPSWMRWSNNVLFICNLSSHFFTLDFRISVWSKSLQCLN